MLHLRGGPLALTLTWPSVSRATPSKTGQSHSQCAEAACVLCAVLPVTNVGNATAAAVPQLYREVESGLG